jgi:outer membrane protein
LQQCVDYALAHNISIKQVELSMQSSKIGKDQSIANFFPSINGNAGQNYYFGRSIDPTTNQYTTNQVQSNNFSLSASMPIFDGLQLQNTLKQSNLNYMASQYDLKKIKNDISLNVVTFYLQVLYNQELVKTTEEEVNATKLQRDRTQRMFDVGALAKGSLLDMEAQLSTDEVRLVNAKSQLAQSLLSLTQLLELDTVKDFSIAQPVIDIPSNAAQENNVEAVYSTALKTQPDIKSSEYKVMGAQKGVSIAKGGRYPRLSVGGSVSSNYSSVQEDLVDYIYGAPRQIGYTIDTVPVYSLYPEATPVLEKKSFGKQFDDNISQSVGFNLSVPVFNGWSTRSNIKRSKINLQQSQLNHESTKKSLYKSVQQAVLDADAAYNRYGANLKSVEALTEAKNYNEQKFNVGLISTYDFLLSKNNLAKSQADLLQAKYDYIFRLKVLDFYMGKPLAF